jgi:ribosomal protein S18 acetylase RimI-like enzyme
MIRPLTESDLEAYVALRRESLLDAPLAFGSSPEDDSAASVETLRAQLQRARDWMLFGAFDEAGRLAGAAGAIRGRHRKSAHKMHVWGVYVRPSARRLGLGRALIEAVIAHARSIAGVDWLQLAVSTSATPARHLYERAGFVAWGTEPDALRYEGESADEVWMALRV